MISGRQDPSSLMARIQAARAARGGGPGGGGPGGGGPTRLGAAARGIGQGFTVGTSDEMMGGIRGIGALWPRGMSPGEAYTAGTEGARARNRASREAYPVTYGAGEVAGAVAPMVGAALMTAPAGGTGGAAVAGSTVARILAGGAKVARGAATRPLLGTMTAGQASRPLVGGAVEGAAHAFGHAEGNPLERIPSAAYGAGFGAAAGGVAQILAGGAGWLGGRSMDLMGLRAATAESTENVAANFLRRIPGVETIQQQAEGRVARALPEGGQHTPDPSGQGPGTFEGRELQEAVDLLEQHPERALMDISRQTQGTARGAATVPGQAREDIPAFLRQRHIGQESRLIDDILELSDQDIRQSFRESTQEIMERRAAAAKPLYEAAQRAPDGSLRTVSRDVVDPDGTLLNEKYFQDAYERGRELARLEGVALPPLTDDLTEIPVQAVNYMKQGVDEMIESGKRTGGMGSRTANAIDGMRREMLVRVDNAVPEFGQARAFWKGGAEELEALEVGRKLFTDPVSDTQHLVSQMSEGEREMFLRGGVEGLSQRLENIPKGRDLTSARPLADRTADTDRLRMLFPGDEAFEAFQGQLENEVRMGASNRFINQQSMTVDKMLEVAEMSGMDTAMLLSGGGSMVSMAAGAARNALRGRMTSYSGDVAEQMAPLLTAQGKDAAAITRRLMEPQQQSIHQGLVTRGVPTVAGATLAGAATGRATGITDDQRDYMISLGVTDEQIALMLRGAG